LRIWRVTINRRVLGEVATAASVGSVIYAGNHAPWVIVAIAVLSAPLVAWAFVAGALVTTVRTGLRPTR
jgi:hypothetical protein